MKKIIFLIIMLFSCIICCKAEKFNGSIMGDNLIEGVYLRRMDAERAIQYKRGRFLRIVETNEFIYCLEPFTLIVNGEEYDVIKDNYKDYFKLSDYDWDRINLISYYGYGYKDENVDHTADRWYYITQVLIWRIAYNGGAFEFTESYHGPVNNTLFFDEIRELEILIDNHYKTPLFDIPELNDDVYAFPDLNGVLSNFDVIGENVKIEDNNIVIDARDGNDISFRLERKKFDNTLKLYYSPDSQKFITGAEDVDVSQYYDVKVVSKKGVINIEKNGESEALSEVKFGLYDEFDNLIREGVTDNSGRLVFDDLRLGKYYVKELVTSSDYVLDDKVYEAELKLMDNGEVQNVYLTINNTLKKGSIVIKKIDSDGNPISDTSFEVIDEEQMVVYEGVTGSDGIIIVPNLPMGFYDIIETKSNANYFGGFRKTVELKENKEEVLVVAVNNKITVDVPDTDTSLNSVNYFKKKEWWEYE